MNNLNRNIWIVLIAGVVIAGGGTAYYAIRKGDVAEKASVDRDKGKAAKLLVLETGHYGLKLSESARKSLDLQPKEAERAVKPRALPPQIGTVNYDMEKMFVVRPRFGGAIEEIKQVPDAECSPGLLKQRSLRWGDRVKPGDTLAVIWSRDLGEKKAALVDAICALKLSQKLLEKQNEAYRKAAFPENALLATERQVQADANAVLTAERTLRMWKLAESEITAIKKEAEAIADVKKMRDPDKEKTWARVEVKAPNNGDDSRKELVVVEKNTQLGDMVDPGRDTPMFKLADLSRLQIWVHPPEEYLPLLREKLKEGPGALKWDIRFQAEGLQTAPLEHLSVTQLSPSLEPNQHTPMLIGYLDNTDGKYLIGQFVTATIYVPPPENTVEIPTDAVNHLDGQELVFVENPDAKDEFHIRRVAVVQSFKGVTLVRSQLTPEDKRLSKVEEGKGRYPIRELQPGERVITRGVVELTSALEDLRNAK